MNSDTTRNADRKLHGIPAGVTAPLLCVLLSLSACDGASEPDLPVASQLSVAPACDLQLGCRAEAEQLAVTVTFGTAPHALRPFPLSLRVDDGQYLESVTVAFAMQGMDMGLNRYRLSGDSMSSWNASITLPICASGRTDWVADFELLAEDRRFRLQVPFTLEK